MKRLTILLCLAGAAALAMAAVSCGKAEEEQPDFNRGGGSHGGGGEDTEAVSPAPCDNIVVAHRGGSAEAKELGRKYPDNSLAALTYTQGLGCFGMECDILWTSDDNVIVHHGSDGMVNGLLVCQHTLAEIRAAGRLSNGEVIPTLEDFLIQTVDKNKCTRLWLEVKNITNSSLTEEQQETAILNAFRRACEIIKDKRAENFIMFNGTGRTSVFSRMFPQAKASGFEMSIAMQLPASTMQKNGWNWANMSISDAAVTTSLLDDYIARKIKFSLYSLDTQADINKFLPYKDHAVGLVTNYPQQLLNAL